MDRPYAGVAVYRQQDGSLDGVRIFFTEASSDNEARSKIDEEACRLKSSQYLIANRPILVFVSEIPQDFIDKFATKQSQQQQLTRAVISDEERGLKTPFVDPGAFPRRSLPPKRGIDP